MNYTIFKPNHSIFLFAFMCLLLNACDSKGKRTTNDTTTTIEAKPVKDVPVNQTATAQQADPAETQQEYCKRIEYRFYTRDIQPFTSNPCKHPVGQKCYWNQVKFHISGPSNNDYTLTKITIDESANLTFGDCRNCQPNGAPKRTSDKVDWLTLCDGNEQTGILSIEVQDKATRKVLGICKKPFKLKVAPPCPVGR